MNGIQTGILTISDRCSRGEAQDKSGLVLQALVEAEGWKVEQYVIVPDTKEEIIAPLLSWADKDHLPLILTTGGTGIGSRDITPEVTKELLEKELPGISELIRREGEKKTIFSCLSRAVAGIRNQTIIINLPGSTNGATESFNAVKKIIPHAVLMLKGEGH